MSNNQELAFITFNKEHPEIAHAALQKAISAYTGVSQASTSRDRFASIDTNTSVRNEFTRGDYSYFRPSEEIPQKQKKIIADCMGAYRRVGLIHNVIDLMADFGAQGVKVQHPNSRIQKFGQNWFTKVGGPERSERFLNLLYRTGNVIIKRLLAKLSAKHEQYLRTLASEILEPDAEFEGPPKITRRTIPIKYGFLNPLTVEAIDNELGQFVGKHFYIIKVTQSLRSVVKNPKTSFQKELVALLPDDIRVRIIRGDKEIPLDPAKISVYHYKKDDWQTWADPMTYAILDDLLLLEKMKLADLAALDGAISQIRVWKLGFINESNMAESIFPTDVAINKLAQILLSNPGGGAFDLIWGPELEVSEYKTNVHEFLGNEKYEPVLNSIYAGLGVPPTLTGAATASGFTNNYISLKTLVQRLEYGRSMLTAFWMQELELLQRAMGFRQPFSLHYDRMILTDEAAEKALLIQMWDRNLVTDETIQERFGEDAELEVMRSRREERERQRRTRPQKASPWHNPDKQFELAKIALQRTLLSPKAAGFEIEDEDYDKPPFLMQLDAGKVSDLGGAPKKSKQSGGTGGRPKNAKDKKQRTRTPKAIGSTAGFLTTLTWAREAQATIAEILNPVLLQHFNKKNVRSLSADEYEESENIKFAALMNVQPFSEISRDTLVQTLSSISLHSEPTILYEKFKKVLYAGKSPTVDELRMARAAVYALINEPFQIDEEENEQNNDNDGYGYEES